jgi:hypothetical protein
MGNKDSVKENALSFECPVLSPAFNVSPIFALKGIDH